MEGIEEEEEDLHDKTLNMDNSIHGLNQSTIIMDENENLYPTTILKNQRLRKKR
jgi:hypothetical protein